MSFSMATEKTSDKTDSTKEDRRSNVDRRRFSYTEYIPERRSDGDRRKDEEVKTEKDQDREWPSFKFFIRKDKGTRTTRVPFLIVILWTYRWRF